MQQAISGRRKNFVSALDARFRKLGQSMVVEHQVSGQFDAIIDAAPSEEMNLRRELAEVEARRENLLQLAEEGESDPDIKRRLAERRRQIHEFRRHLQLLESRQPTTKSLLTQESLVTDLQNLTERLQGSEAAAGEVLRKLLGGRIVVEEVRPMGSRHGFLRGTLDVRVYDVSQAINCGAEISTDASEALVSRVIDFIDPENTKVTNQLRELAWNLYSEGRLAKEIGAELNVNRNRVKKLLEEAAKPVAKTCSMVERAVQTSPRSIWNHRFTRRLHLV